MAKKKTGFDYREKAEELEQVVSKLQNPEIEIDEATKLHEAGLKLVAELEQYLNQAEIEIHKHLTDSE